MIRVQTRWEGALSIFFGYYLFCVDVCFFCGLRKDRKGSGWGTFFPRGRGKGKGFLGDSLAYLIVSYCEEYMYFQSRRNKQSMRYRGWVCVVVVDSGIIYLESVWR